MTSAWDASASHYSTVDAKTFYFNVVKARRSMKTIQKRGGGDFRPSCRVMDIATQTTVGGDGHAYLQVIYV